MHAALDFVIVTPLEEELRAVLKKLSNAKKLPPTEHDIRTYFYSELPFQYPDGTSGTYHIGVLSLVGMGRVEAANATNDAIRRWQPTYVLLVGIAGGLATAGVELGDVLIADQIADYELQKLRPDHREIRWQVHRADPRLLNSARNFLSDEWLSLVRIERPKPGQPKRHIGTICTGDKVIADQLPIEYRSTWGRLIGVEMEAGGAATAAFQAVSAPGFFMVRGVSDLADEQKDSPSVRSWRAYASDVAASYAIALLQSGPVPMRGTEVSPSNQDVHLLLSNSLARHRFEIMESGERILACRDFRIALHDFFYGSMPAQPRYFELLVTHEATGRRASLDQAILDGDRPILLIGGTGSGKTTMQLKAFSDCYESGSALYGRYYPVWLTWSAGPNRKFIEHFGDSLGLPFEVSSNPELLRRLLAETSPVLIFVDLNEVDFSQRIQVAKQLANWIADPALRHHRLVIAYRIEGVLTKDQAFQVLTSAPPGMLPQGQGFEKWYIEPLARDQATAYYRSVWGQSARIEEDLKSLVDRYRELVELPLILHLLTVAGKELAGGTLGALFAKTLERWISLYEVRLEHTGVRVAHNLLANLAVTMVQNGTASLAMSQTRSLLDELRAEMWWPRWQDGTHVDRDLVLRELLVEGSPLVLRGNAVSFVHDSLAFYLAGYHLINRDHDLRRPKAEWMRQYERCDEYERWRLPLYMASGLLSSSEMADLVDSIALRWADLPYALDFLPEHLCATKRSQTLFELLSAPAFRERKRKVYKSDAPFLRDLAWAIRDANSPGSADLNGFILFSAVDAIIRSGALQIPDSLLTFLALNDEIVRAFVLAGLKGEPTARVLARLAVVDGVIEVDKVRAAQQLREIEEDIEELRGERGEPVAKLVFELARRQAKIEPRIALKCIPKLCSSYGSETSEVLELVLAAPLASDVLEAILWDAIKILPGLPAHRQRDWVEKLSAKAYALGQEQLLLNLLKFVRGDSNKDKDRDYGIEAQLWALLAGWRREEAEQNLNELRLAAGKIEEEQVRNRAQQAIFAATNRAGFTWVGPKPDGIAPSIVDDTEKLRLLARLDVLAAIALVTNKEAQDPSKHALSLAHLAEGIAKDTPYAARKLLKHIISLLDTLKSYQLKDVVTAIYSAALLLNEWEQADVGGELFRKIQSESINRHLGLPGYAYAVALIGEHDGRDPKKLHRKHGGQEVAESGETASRSGAPEPPMQRLADELVNLVEDSLKRGHDVAEIASEMAGVLAKMQGPARRLYRLAVESVKGNGDADSKRRTIEHMGKILLLHPSVADNSIAEELIDACQTKVYWGSEARFAFATAKLLIPSGVDSALGVLNSIEHPSDRVVYLGKLAMLCADTLPMETLELITNAAESAIANERYSQNAEFYLRPIAEALDLRGSPAAQRLRDKIHKTARFMELLPEIAVTLAPRRPLRSLEILVEAIEEASHSTKPGYHLFVRATAAETARWLTSDQIGSAWDRIESVAKVQRDEIWRELLKGQISRIPEIVVDHMRHGLSVQSQIEIAGRLANVWQSERPELAGQIAKQYLVHDRGAAVLNALSLAWYSAALDEKNSYVAADCADRAVQLILRDFKGHEQKWWSPNIAEAILASALPLPQRLGFIDQIIKMAESNMDTMASSLRGYVFPEICERLITVDLNAADKLADKIQDRHQRALMRCLIANAKCRKNQDDAMVACVRGADEANFPRGEHRIGFLAAPGPREQVVDKNRMLEPLLDGVASLGSEEALRFVCVLIEKGRYFGAEHLFDLLASIAPTLYSARGATELLGLNQALSALLSRYFGQRHALHSETPRTVAQFTVSFDASGELRVDEAAN